MRFFLFVLILVGCVQDNLSPESALKSFIELRSGAVVSRDEVLSRISGKMRESIVNMPEADFEKYADMKNIKFDSFKILSKSCTEERCFITYSIEFSTLNENKTGSKSEVKKIAELSKEDGKWLISDVTNMKTYHDMIEPINAL